MTNDLELDHNGLPLLISSSGYLRDYADLEWLESAVEAINRAKGWYDEERSFGDMIALLHSEVSEMLEAYRDYGLEDATRYHDIPMDDTLQPKPEGVGAEAADVLIRLLDLTARYNIDLPEEVARKLRYNATRPHRHGGKRL